MEEEPMKNLAHHTELAWEPSQTPDAEVRPARVTPVVRRYGRRQEAVRRP
jgi:hypothetical protein